jgi:hypothetical protein
MCVCGNIKKKKEKKLSSFLYRDNVDVGSQNGLCVRKRKNNIYLKKVSSIMKRRQLMTDRLGTACL